MQNVMRTESVTAPLSDISERVLSVLPDLLSSFLLINEFPTLLFLHKSVDREQSRKLLTL